MAPAHLRLRNTDERYGRICPLCAGPKTVQASMCRPCFEESERPDEFYARRLCACGSRKSRDASGCRACYADRRRGVSIEGHAQPADHPWRKKDRLLYDRVSLLASGVQQ